MYLSFAFVLSLGINVTLGILMFKLNSCVDQPFVPNQIKKPLFVPSKPTLPTPVQTSTTPELTSVSLSPITEWDRFFAENGYTVRRQGFARDNKTKFNFPDEDTRVKRSLVNVSQLLDLLESVDSDFYDGQLYEPSDQQPALVPEIITETFKGAEGTTRRRVVDLPYLPFLERRINSCIKRAQRFEGLRCDTKIVNEVIDEKHPEVAETKLRSNKVYNDKKYFNNAPYREEFKSSFTKDLYDETNYNFEDKFLKKLVMHYELARFDNLKYRKLLRKVTDTIRNSTWWIYSDFIRYDDTSVKFSFQHNSPCCYIPEGTIIHAVQAVCPMGIHGTPLFLYTDWKAIETLVQTSNSRIGVWRNERPDELCTMLPGTLIPCYKLGMKNVFVQSRRCTDPDAIFDSSIIWVKVLMGGGLY